MAHSLVAVISEHEDVLCLTRRPKEWSSRLSYIQADAAEKVCSYQVLATDDPSCVGDAEIVFIALPKFAVYEELTKIEPWLRKGQTVCIVHAPSGLEKCVHDYAVRGIDLVGFQRVPYISRIREYGRSVSISDHRAEHRIVVSRPDIRDFWISFCRDYFHGRTCFLSSFWVFAFSNAGALLHPARMAEIFRNWDGSPLPRNPNFYSEWTDDSSRLYVDMDQEMLDVMSHYSQIDLSTDYESALDHYGVSDIPGLTAKIRSIPSFKNILSPLIKVDEGWLPDKTSRYFTEDVELGTKVIQSYARDVGIAVPTIDEVIKSVTKVFGGVS